MNRAHSPASPDRIDSAADLAVTDARLQQDHKAGPAADAVPAPWAGVTLPDLFDASVEASPQAVAFRQPDETGPGLRSLTFAAAGRAVQRLTEHFADIGLQPGQTVVLSLNGCCEAPIAVLAALRAGLVPCLATPALPVEAMTDLMARPGHAAVVTAGAIGTLRPAERWRTACVSAGPGRFVLAFGDRLPGGVLKLDGLFNSTADAGYAPANNRRAPAPLRVAQPLGEGVAVYTHAQEGLVAAGLMMVLRTGMASAAPLLTTLAPLSHASLVTGLMPSLLTGGTLWQVPAFQGAGLVAALDAMGKGHVVVPAALEETLAGAGLRDGAASLTVLHRPPVRLDVPRLAVSSGGVVVDALACGEHGLLTARRSPDGMPALAVGEARIPDEGGALALRVETGPGGRLYVAGAATASRIETAAGGLAIWETGLACRTDAAGRILALTPS